jgi:cytochrome c oxidase subunit III
MSTTLVPPKPKSRREPSSVKLPGGGNGFDGGGFGGGGPERQGWSVPAHTYRTGMWMALVAIVMLFAAFTSAMVVRKGLNADWISTSLPHILYVNTVILLASSVTLEISRRSLARGLGGGFAAWLYATSGLGVAFMGGQLSAWHALGARGVYLATNPSSSFFYLLTAAHGVHLLGGIAALFYLSLHARRIAVTAEKRTAVDVTAIYWHFMDGLWIYILALMMMRL